ncbi:hypothetical protein B0T10DRAFT_463298 [Thelonectria olida]|uniref:Uncharacterized protein n=1 Tax=Thelonectria olida TaxID=1576542 RepID=A0A9P8VYC8_9HYPO|nr:hypothetical protein B0T10DRAFT_463298 [Thelonectria olida]
MRYLPLILAVLPLGAQAICKDPPCRPEPVDPPVPACASADRCGTACCGRFSLSGYSYPHCANPAKSLCCPEGWVEVGNTGKCCPRGFILLGGAKCYPRRTVLCGGEYCVGLCDSVSRKCRSTITDQECQALGWAGAYATTPRSYSCDTYDEMGCCQPVPPQ